MVGKVYLVGAGPGDPGLLTLRGVECLAQADLVLYDGLVNPVLLKYAHAHCERTARVGGAGGDSRQLNQEEINARLVAAGLEGKTVVRLKGGDPFIFGRGSEEAAALEGAGIPYEVVPGITAATGAAVYAGISLTHRERASAVAFVTGHEAPDKEASALDYEQLARFPGTLVFYMGLRQIGSIAASLAAHGKPSSTPVAVVCRATTPRQRVVTGMLADISEKVAAAGLHAPSLIIVGDCVEQREKIHWFERRPLFGLRIGITRAEEQFLDVLSLGTELGAELVPMPVIEIQPVTDWTAVDAAIARLAEFSWLVFTSVNGVRAFLDRLWSLGKDIRVLGGVRLAAIGPSTAQELERYRLKADLVPPAYRAEELVSALAPHALGRRVLWVRASRGRDVIPEGLTAAGATLEQVVAYHNLDIAAWTSDIAKRLVDGELDWIALSSPAIARHVARLIPVEARSRLTEGQIRVAAISPVTADAAREAGLPVHAVAEEFTWAGLFSAIQKVFESRQALS